MGMDCRHWYGYLPGHVCQTPQDWKDWRETTEFYMANDLGRSGYYYDQKPASS